MVLLIAVVKPMVHGGQRWHLTIIFLDLVVAQTPIQERQKVSEIVSGITSVPLREKFHGNGIQWTV